MAGTLFVVATPIGNLEDITARALRILRQAALIAAEDTRRTAKLLARYDISTPTTSLHEHNERIKTTRLLGRLAEGDDIALVSDAGTPTVSDPGSHLIAEAVRRGLRVEPIPGPNAAIAALSASGIVTDSFTFLGFPPTRSKDRIPWFSRLGRAGGTVVFHESPHRIRQTLEELQARYGDLHVVVARELTKSHEEFIRGPISIALQSLQKPVGELTIVAEVGQKIENEPVSPPTPTVLASEFWYLTHTSGFTRRQAIAAISKRYKMPARDVYGAVEQAKNSGG